MASPSRFFIDALVGKERRVRPVDGVTTIDGSNALVNSGDADFAQCSPLVGVKLGIARRFDNDWELAGAVGVALSLVNSDDKVRQHELFADVEANKYLGGGGAFLGVGASLWDLTRRDTMTPALLAHVGIPLAKGPAPAVHLLVEGRMFLDHADDIRNNYLVWAGVRVHF
jgi:hypothetical protein